MLRDALEAFRALREGDVARSIPELARADPEQFSVATCTVDGALDEAGDVRQAFTIQSISKPFLYGWALETLGPAEVHERVGAEPTGDAFDSFVTLEARRHRPHNPMVNAGAIAVSGLFLEAHPRDAREALHAWFEGFVGGGPLRVDEAVFASERASAHRNRAIAHLLRHFSRLGPPVDEVLDLYFHQCSLLVTCRDLAVMAATLANGGTHPLGGTARLTPANARRVRAVMTTCGLYDASGSFAFDVGLPAKSSISGGLLAVARGRLGLAVHAPRLDACGNSVRGVAVARRLSNERGLHFLNARGPRRTEGLAALIADLPQATREETSGRCASYAPTLAAADPEAFGLALCTVEGEEHAVGTAEEPFTLQAVANPLVYALTAGWVGSEAIHARVGREPSGNPFHAIVFDRRTNKPFNPYGNAGAIALCDLVPGPTVEERSQRVLEGLGALAGGAPFAVDAQVLREERAASERNHAIACLLRSEELVADEEAALELYLRNCSVRATCRSLARLGATLAAGGTLPGLGARVVSERHVRDTLVLMSISGLHDESGQFAVDVGLPAKTGVSGAILAVWPGRFAIAVHAPRVNRYGSSVRGLTALRLLAARLDPVVAG